MDIKIVYKIHSSTVLVYDTCDGSEGTLSVVGDGVGKGED